MWHSEGDLAETGKKKETDKKEDKGNKGEREKDMVRSSPMTDEILLLVTNFLEMLRSTLLTIYHVDLYLMPNVVS